MKFHLYRIFEITKFQEQKTNLYYLGGKPCDYQGIGQESYNKNGIIMYLVTGEVTLNYIRDKIVRSKRH